LFNTADKLICIAAAFAIVLAILSVPLFFVGRAIARVNPRFRFSLRRLFAFITAAAVSLGIVRLPLPEPAKFAVLSVFLTWAFWLAGRYPYVPRGPAANDCSE